MQDHGYSPSLALIDLIVLSSFRQLTGLGCTDQCRAFLVKLTQVMRILDATRCRRRRAFRGYVEQALAGSDPKLIL